MNKKFKVTEWGVVTELRVDDSIPNSSSQSSEFTTITTETILVSSNSSSNSITIENNISPKNLIKLYDETFDEPEQYNDFVNSKLTPWKSTLKFQLFDLHYNRHRTSLHNMKAERNLAQKLLEEADNLQKDHEKQQERFYQFISRITWQNLKDRKSVV